MGASVSKSKNASRAGPGYVATDPLSPTYLQDVVEKVRKHPRFKEGLTEDQIVAKAKHLTDPAELHADFSHLTDLVFEAQVSEARDEAEKTNYGEDFATDCEEQHARIRAKSRLQRASDIPIKLRLLKLQRENIPPRFATAFARMLALKYGPLHAALVVGDVTLEWNDSSLVVPHREAVYPDLQMDIRKDTAAMKLAASKKPALMAAVDSLDYNEQMELIYDVSVDRKKMIDDLINVIATYNQLYEYDLVRRNCQTFVTDAMKALGIQKPPKMTGRLKDYHKELKTGKTRAPNDFSTHEELDQYVRDSQGTGEFDQLTQHDKEYLLCIYFKFHLETLEEDKGEPCRVPNCMQGQLENAIEEDSLILQAF